MSKRKTKKEIRNLKVKIPICKKCNSNLKVVKIIGSVNSFACNNCMRII